MARTALVTGGSEGIGAAIGETLTAAGHRVVATYAGNDAAAEASSARTAIPMRKWDVADIDACLPADMAGHLTGARLSENGGRYMA